MKKEYIIPETIETRVDLTQMIAVSGPQVGGGEIGEDDELGKEYEGGGVWE